MKARIEKDGNNTHRVFVQRAKYKHWFELGRHRDTDNAFAKALNEKTVVWEQTVTRHQTLFEK